MKKTLIIIVLLIPSCLFVYSSFADKIAPAAANQKQVEKLVSAQEIVTTHNDKIVVNYENYIERMNIFITISFAIFGLFIAINIINGNRNLDDSKTELNNIKAEFTKLKNEKNEIITEIKEYGKNIFNDYLTHYRIKAAKEDLEKLLLEDKPDKQQVFDKLSQILEHVDSLNIDLYSRCLKKFQGDQDILRLCTRGLDIISTEQNNLSQKKAS